MSAAHEMPTLKLQNIKKKQKNQHTEREKQAPERLPGLVSFMDQWLHLPTGKIFGFMEV